MAGAAAVVAGCADGSVVALDLRDGRRIDSVSLGEPPLSLLSLGETLVVMTAQKLVVFSLLGRSADNFSQPCASGFRKLWERRVPSNFREFVGQPVPYGPHLVVAAGAPGAFGLCCFRVDTREDLWDGDTAKTVPGELAFIAPVGAGGIVVGNTDGLAVAFAGIKGAETFRHTLAGGLHRSCARVAVDDGRLHYFNERGELWRVELGGRQEFEPVGVVHIPSPSSLGVSPRQIVVGDRHGVATRFDGYGFNPRRHQISGRADEGWNGLLLPPVIMEDGTALLISESGIVLAYGPPGDAPPLERTIPFVTHGAVASWMFVGPTIVAASSTGEIQALTVVD